MLEENILQKRTGGRRGVRKEQRRRKDKKGSREEERRWRRAQEDPALPTACRRLPGPPHPAWHPLLPDAVVVSEHPELGAGHSENKRAEGEAAGNPGAPREPALSPWQAFRSCLGAGALPGWGRTQVVSRNRLSRRAEPQGSPTWGAGHGVRVAEMAVEAA